MEILPIEVLANQIFKYFIFESWMKNLVRVCKRWQQAAISSNATKQIALDLWNVPLRCACLPAISKYRVDTLILDGAGPSGSLIEFIVNASPKLNTLVLLASVDMEVFTEATSMQEMADIEPKRIFPHITTLAISDEKFPVLSAFPNVTKLRIEDWNDTDWKDLDEESVPVFTKVRELEVACNNLADLDRIEHQFPSVATLHITSLTYQTNSAQIIAQAKKMGITESYMDNPHLSAESFRSPNISYYLFSMQHRKTPLIHPLLANGCNCTREEFQEISARTSIMYEQELTAERYMEFNFPARVTDLTANAPFQIGRLSRIKNPDLIKPYYDNKYTDFLTAFRLAVERDSVDYALELAPEIAEHLDEFDSCKEIITLFEKIPILLRFLDVVGSEATRKIMTTKFKNGFTVIENWAMYPSHPIEWSPLDEFIDWNMKVKLANENNQEIQVNLATVAFENREFDKWAFLVKQKKLSVEIELYSQGRIENYVEAYGLADLQLLAPTPEATQNLLFAALAVLEDESQEQLLHHIISKFGSEKLRECRNGEYALHYALSRRSRATYINFWHYLLGDLELDVNYIDKSGKTPIIMVLDKLREDEEFKAVFELFLELGADPNLAVDTMLPLFLAMDLPSFSSTGMQIALIDTLLEYGADINAVDFDQNGRRATPLSFAVSVAASPDLIRNLIFRGADPKFFDDAGNTLMHTVLLAEELEQIIELIPLLARHVDINQPNLLDETPLHRALLSGYDVTLVSALIAHGADVNRPGGPQLQIPLIMAVNYFPAFKVLMAQEKIDIRAKNRYGESLFYALCRINVSSEDFSDIITLLDGKPGAFPKVTTLKFLIAFYRQGFYRHRC